MIDNNLLNNFCSFTVDTLSQKSLFTNRQDRKFVFSSELLNQVLEICSQEYRILEIDGIRNFKYKTTYYDTVSLDMYHDHHRGKKNRCKIRERQYLDSQIGFYEIKIKNNKGLTVKYRIKNNQSTAFNDLISLHTRFSFKELKQIFHLDYYRITLLHKVKNEKVTIDNSLNYSMQDRIVPFNNFVFAEVKTNNGHDISFCEKMKNMGIVRGSLSKYCLGILCYYPGIKQNNFKQSYKKFQKKSDDVYC